MLLCWSQTLSSMAILHMANAPCAEVPFQQMCAADCFIPPGGIFWSLQAVTWIKKREGKQLEGKVKTFNDSDFLKQLELAIQYGSPFLFENLDEYLDPVINTVLEKSFTMTVRGA